MSGRRLATGGLIDRDRPVTFQVDGRSYAGFAGDTLASALMASGVRVMGRSFKYHRPRGVLAAGVEEPNALFAVGQGGRLEPNTRATDAFLYEGLSAVSQNRWPSLGLDIGSVNRWIAPFIPAGFYYKTFFGGPRLWKLYEHFIRRAAGLGPAPQIPDVDVYEHRAGFCDVLVVGSGPSGLAAASAASRAGARVMLVEQDVRLGGALLRDPALVDGQAPEAFAERVRGQVIAAGGRVLTRTTAAGLWDHGLATLVERVCEPGAEPATPNGLTQRLWRVRAGRIVLATGALERPMLFAGNDLPGVMLSTAVRTYLRRYAVSPGQKVAVVTCNDDAYRTVAALTEAGVTVAAVLDSRPAAEGDLARRVAQTVPAYFNARPVEAKGGKGGVSRLTAVADGRPLEIACDVVAVSGGFSPVVHLHMQAGGGLVFDAASGAFTPGAARNVQTTVGAAAGQDGLGAVLADGWAGGARAAGAEAPLLGAPAADDADPVSTAGTAYDLAPGVHLKTAFVDYQNDVTAADLDLAWREGYRSVEHLKRYTTLGMATDQGKTSNLVGLSRLASNEGRPMPEVGLTTFRPPYTPTTLGALAGEATGAHAAPQRRMALHALHAAREPIWQPSGYWARPRAFPQPGETLETSALREARAVRNAVGLTDVSTLAKFEVVGPDAAALLERICATTAAKLAVGRGRYTFMLREDGFVVDDGTIWRLEDQRYLLTSSTGGADRMTAHISYVRRVLAPELKASVVGVQEHWAGAAFAGPEARAALAELLGDDPPRHMSCGVGRIAGVSVRVLAASYSGERAFEIYTAAFEAAPVWTALADAAEARGGAVYGLEALELLRIEKGHPEVGAEIDGRRTPADLGLQKMLNPRGGFVGAACLARPALHSEGRQTLVGLQADGPIPEGAMLLPPGSAGFQPATSDVYRGLEARAPKDGAAAAPIGHVTSAGLDLAGGGGVALALLENGVARLGQTLVASSPTRNRVVSVRVTSPHHYDPAGDRYRD
jgi:sarcosine oxidase subunit alpha